MSTVRKKFASMFSGGGFADIGAKRAGYEPIWGIEYDDAIADAYAANIGPHIIRDMVQCVDPHELEKPDLLWASPVCKSFSVANAGGSEHDLDIVCAQAVAHFLRVLSPPAFVLENVREYAKSQSMDIIREALQDVYGWWDEGVFNSADFSVPQTRKRFIVRANGGMITPLRKASRWIGWYEAIEDLIPTLPPSQFAPWQLARLPEDLLGTSLVGADSKLTTVCDSEPSQTVVSEWDRSLRAKAFIVEGTAAVMDNKFPLPVRSEEKPVFTVHGTNPTRAFLIEGDAAGERWDTVLPDTDPSFTLKTSGGGRVHRAFLVDGANAGREITLRNQNDPTQTITGSHKGIPRAFLVDGKPANYAGDLCVKRSCEAVTTGTASQEKHPFRAWLDQGRVVAMTARALARFQSCPDWYVLPEKKSMACTIIGNGVPCLMAEAMIRSVGGAS